MSAEFKFKNFIVRQDGASHKVGVDSVLLGAWCSACQAKNILDIGTGTGILALMMAQEYSLAYIDAVEIDNQAFECAKVNFLSSVYSQRIAAHKLPVQEFKSTVNYDLIICNPPYFNKSLLPDSVPKKVARHTTSLTVKDLYSSFNRLLKDNGEAYLIIPGSQLQLHLQEAGISGLFLIKHCSVKPKPQKEANRELLCFAKKYKALQNEEIILRDENNAFTQAYKQLTKDFYLSL